MTVERRIARLEASIDPAGSGLSHLTDDEVSIRLLDTARAFLACDAAPVEYPELCAQAALTVAELEASIVAMAAHQCTPGYDKHIAWVQGDRADLRPYVLAVFGSEYDGLDRTRIMERRAALRARPDVQALIAQGIAAAGVVANSPEPSPPA